MSVARLLPASKGENEMKRSLRVASVFTGAVACTTALAPMADAATVTPNTVTAGNCSPAEGPQVHLYYSAHANHSLAACLKGGPGYFGFGAGKKFAGICGGAWSGIFYYGVPGTAISGSAYFSQSYRPTYWKQTDIIYGVDIVGYHYIQGETSCPNHG
jgi:hypothetical protein